MSDGLFWDSVPENTRGALEAVKALPMLSDFYLAGGTALALQIGHRVSHDLDFFSSNNQLQFAERTALTTQLQQSNHVTIQRETDTMVYAAVMGVEVSFIYQHHPLLYSVTDWENVAIAGLLDIGLMKFSA